MVVLCWSLWFDGGVLFWCFNGVFIGVMVMFMVVLWCVMAVSWVFCVWFCGEPSSAVLRDGQPLFAFFGALFLLCFGRFRFQVRLPSKEKK